MLRNRAWLVAAAIVWWSAPPCATAALAQAVQRDSAGIRIIENRPATAGSIRIDDQPALTIQLGAQESRSDGAARTVRLADGTIVLADRAGRWLSYDSAGRRTELQTELPARYPLWVSRFADDSVVVMFKSPPGVYYLDRSLRVADTCRFQGVLPYGSDDPSPILDDGAIVLQVRHGINLARDDTLTRDSVALTIMPRNCSAPRQLSVEPTGLSFTASARITPTSMSVVTLQTAFARHLSVATEGSALFLGDGDKFEIRQMSGQGETLRLIRSLREARPAALSDSQRFTRFRGTTLGDAMLANAPRTIPFFARVEVDAIGRVWAQDFRVADGVQEWTMFTADGVEAGRLSMPHNLTVISFGAADVLTTETTPQGIETIRVLGLRFP